MIFTGKENASTMAPAATQFACVPELLACLGHVIASRTLLLDLCLTSKSFNAIFTPILYVELWFRESNRHIILENLEALLSNSALKHVRTLDFCIPMSTGEANSSQGQQCESFNEAVQAIVSKTPGLIKFSWEDQPLFTTTLSTLHEKCPNIEFLSISHPVDIETLLGTAFESDGFDFEDGFFELRPLFDSQDFSQFRNLTELEIHEIYGDLSKIRADVAKALLNSPNLRSLSLSLNAETVIRLEQEAEDIEAMGGYLDFLQKLVSEFVATGGKPLHLRKLVLGLCVILWEEEEHQPATYLNRLTDLAALEEVFICNNGIGVALYFSDPDGIAWSTFTPTTCPNLIILGLHNYTYEVKRWIKGLKPGYLRQVIIEDTMGDEITDIALVLDKIEQQQNKPLSMLTIVNENLSLQGPDGLITWTIAGLQALSITLPNLQPKDRAALATWLAKFDSLEQLCLRQSHVVLEEDTGDEGLALEIATALPTLRYLKLEKNAWCIWRGNEKSGKQKIRLERLDRFEEQDVEAFRSQRYFAANW